MVIFASILTFVAVFLTIFAINLLLTDVFRAEQSEQSRRAEPKKRERLRKELRQELHEQEAAAGGLAELSQQLELEKVASPWERFQDFVAQSGTRTPAAHILIQSAIVAVICGFLLSFVVGALGNLFLTTFLSMTPVARIAWIRSKRLAKIREQLPDALELIGRVLRAGQTIVQAMNSIGEEYGDPIGTEFARCYEQQNLGLSVDVAMKDMARRVGLIEFKIFVLGVLIQRQAGGNLTELLDRLAGMVRNRMLLRGEIKSLTAEGRVQALVLIALPIGVWAALSVLNPDYAYALFDHQPLLIGTMTLMFLGAVWINRIVNFDF